MQLGHKIRFSYPDGPDQPPICRSWDVIQEFGLQKEASEFLQYDVRARRAFLASGRSVAVNAWPRYLYKYRALNAENELSIQVARKLLVHGQIWAASPASLNDPAEMGFKLALNPDPGARRAWVDAAIRSMPRLSPAACIKRKAELLRMQITPSMEASFRQQVATSMGVFCASTDPRSKTGWAHYGDEHKGFCVQFATFEDELFLAAREVIYSQTFPILMVPEKAGQQQEYYLTKDAAWKEEKEWRVVVPVQNCAISLHPRAISGLILGRRMAPKTQKILSELLQERERANLPALQIYQEWASLNSFHIRIQRYEGIDLRQLGTYRY